MIRGIELINFKSHKKCEIDIGNITILTGLNGVGKSSVFHALLLLRQTARKAMLKNGLELKGDLCYIGTAREALHQGADTDELSIKIVDEDAGLCSFDFSFNENKQDDTFLKCLREHNYPEALNLFSDNFQYISAFRNGPMRDYERDTSQVEVFKQISMKEGRCELTAHYLYHYGNEHVSDESLVFDGFDDKKLKVNVELWMDAISPGIQIFIDPLQSGFQLNYKYSRGVGRTPTEPFRAINIGFGVSYVLPIVVAALHAPKGSIILIENPEAHIHPAGQSKLMELICKAAKAGVQFIIETHSDHVINGTLVSIKKSLLDSNEVSIYYFDRKEESHETIAHKLCVRDGGRISSPPKGFFDQINIDMKTLMGF